MSTPHTHGPDDPRRIGALLRVPAARANRMIYEGLLAHFPEMRPVHQPVFQHIDHPPAGTRLTVLADRSGVSKQALIEIVDDLERYGMVERIADPADRRAKLIRLTARGWALHEAARDVVLAVEEEWAALLGEADFTELKRLLERLADRLAVDLRHDAQGSG